MSFGWKKKYVFLFEVSDKLEKQRKRCSLKPSYMKNSSSWRVQTAATRQKKYKDLQNLIWMLLNQNIHHVLKCWLQKHKHTNDENTIPPRSYRHPSKINTIWSACHWNKTAQITVPDRSVKVQSRSLFATKVWPWIYKLMFFCSAKLLLFASVEVIFGKLLLRPLWSKRAASVVQALLSFMLRHEIWN